MKNYEIIVILGKRTRLHRPVWIGAIANDTSEDSLRQRTYRWWYEGSEVFSYDSPPWKSSNGRNEVVTGPSCILWQRFDNYTAGWQDHRCRRTNYKKCLCEAIDDIPLP